MRCGGRLLACVIMTWNMPLKLGVALASRGVAPSGAPQPASRGHRPPRARATLRHGLGRPQRAAPLALAALHLGQRWPARLPHSGTRRRARRRESDCCRRRSRASARARAWAASTSLAARTKRLPCSGVRSRGMASCFTRVRVTARAALPSSRFVATVTVSHRERRLERHLIANGAASLASLQFRRCCGQRLGARRGSRRRDAPAFGE